MTRLLKVLIVDDSAHDAELLALALERAGCAANWERVDTEEEYLARLEDLADPPDIILSDYSMPFFYGSRAIALLKASGRDIPLIIVSGTIGEEKAVLTIKQGAVDYLLKDRLARLGPAVRQALEQTRLRRERRKLIEQQKDLELRLLRAQRMESIGTLASGVAHDLNNILSPILMSAALLREPIPPEDFDCLVRTIEESAQRGAGIVKQVLTFARGIEGERVPVQPKHLLREMERIAFQTFPKNITIVQAVSDELGIIEGDVTQLHQVLMNLCVNARDAMCGGGTLTIGAENFEIDEYYASMLPEARPGSYVRFTVKDTGSGIPREILSKIFDPFFTTKEVGKGTGLGLSTVLGIVQSHGGFLTVESKADEGTTFRFHLPVATHAVALASGTEEAPGPEGCGERILLVDDEENIRDVMTCLLRRHGYEVSCARDGAEAVALFALQKAEIAAVVTDVSMPVLDGVGAVRAIRHIDPAARIIACTGYEEEPQRKELSRLAVAAFLTKPYNTPQLLRTLREVMESGRAVEPENFTEMETTL